MTQDIKQAGYDEAEADSITDGGQTMNTDRDDVGGVLTAFTDLINHAVAPEPLTLEEIAELFGPRPLRAQGEIVPNVYATSLPIDSDEGLAQP